MRVFSIEGKIEREGELPADFKGYFVLEKSGQIKGYIKDLSHHNSEKYINGRYDEINNNLVYLQMSMEKKLSPLLYCFPNLEKDGRWTAFSQFFGRFFAFEQEEGYAKATIRETSKNPEDVLTIYNKIIDDGSMLNMVLMKNGVDNYMGELF